MMDRVGLLKQNIEKQLNKTNSIPKQAPRKGLLARKGQAKQKTPSSGKQNAELEIVIDYIKQIRQNKDEILNG